MFVRRLADPRAQKGALLAQRVKRLGFRSFSVPTPKGRRYVLRHDGDKWTCKCPDARKGHFCKHMHAVEIALKSKSLMEEGADQAPGIKWERREHKCPRRGCGSRQLRKKGKRKNKKGEVQRYQCAKCRHRFILRFGFQRLSDDRQLALAVYDLHCRGLAVRKIVDHYRALGVKLASSTVHRWVRKAGAHLSKLQEATFPKPSKTWHADETNIPVAGKLTPNWVVLDGATRLVLAAIFNEERSVNTARIPFREARIRAGLKPRIVITDGFPGYSEAIRKELYDRIHPPHHFIIPPLRAPVKGMDQHLHPGNNIIERFNSTLKARTRTLRGLKSLPSAQIFMDHWIAHYNLVRPHQGLGGLTPAQAAGWLQPAYPGLTAYESLFVAADELACSLPGTHFGPGGRSATEGGEGES